MAGSSPPLLKLCLCEEMPMSEIQEKIVPQERLESVDVLRGFDMFWIVGGGAIFASLHDIFDNNITATIQ